MRLGLEVKVSLLTKLCEQNVDAERYINCVLVGCNLFIDPVVTYVSDQYVCYSQALLNNLSDGFVQRA